MIPDANCYVSHDEQAGLVKIGNDKIERVLQYDLEKERFFTREFRNKVTGQNWSVSESREFRLSITIGDKTITVQNNPEGSSGGLRFAGHAVEELADGGRRLKVSLQSTLVPMQVHVYQEIHPGCNWLRRWIGTENNGTAPLTVTRYDPEIIAIPPDLKGYYFNSWRWGCGSFVRNDLSRAGTGVHSFNTVGRVVRPATVPTDSPLVISDQEEKDFLWFFPEIPIKSVVIREDPHPRLYTSNPWDANVPPGTSVEFSAAVVTGIGTGKHQDGFHSFRSYLDTWVVGDNMDSTKAMLVYNSWYGCGRFINEKDCLQQIDACIELGLDMFVLDAGWHMHLGDWEVDRSNFPNGLKVVSDYCHAKGLKFGIWVDVRAMCKCSRLYADHPEWTVKRPDGSLYEEDFYEHRMVAVCLSSDYGQYIKHKFVQMAEELKLDGLKVDNVGLMSGYDFWTQCHAADHNHIPGTSHRATWDKWGEILDAIKAVRPQIIIESIPSGLSLLGKHHTTWTADYHYRPDWMKEAYFYRAFNYHMAYTHPIATIHQGWASTECADLQTLDYLCASTIGSNVQCGVTGRIESATQVQKAVLKKWIDWHKANKRYLAVYQHLFEDCPPIPLEKATDDDLALAVANRWQPSDIDGFAHLLSDGGWIFLFNPTDVRKSVSFTLRLSDYGINEFSAVTQFDGFDFRPDDNTLTLNRTLPAGSYSQSWVQTGYPVRIKRIQTKITAVDWGEENKELTILTIGQDGRYVVVLTTNGLGCPKTCENCTVTDYEPSTDTLTIAYHLVAGIATGSLNPIRIRWS